MPVTQDDFNEYLKQPIFFPEEFKDWVSDWFATNVPKLHVSQIFGFKLQSTKAAAEITGQQDLSSTSYVSFSTDGPTFDHIPSGHYLLFFGATYGNTAGQPAFDATWPAVYLAPVYDGSTPDDGEACFLNAGSNGKVTFIDLTAPGDNHTLTFKYKLSLASSVVALWNRWAYLLKVVTE